MKKILISVSGGRTSAFMSIYLKTRYPKADIINVFANTGKENEKTYEFIDKLDKEFKLNIVWLEPVVNPEKGKGTTYKIVDFKTANRHGKPFEDVIKKYGLPSKLYKHCTREMKQYPIYKYGKDYFKSDFVTAIGIRADERHRMTKAKNIIYPLCELNITKQFILDWWKDQPFDLELPEHYGNCDFCFLKSMRKRMKIIKEGINIDWWDRMETTYSKPYQSMFDVRNNKTVKNLIDDVAQDNQIDLFNDIEYDCFCKAD